MKHRLILTAAILTMASPALWAQQVVTVPVPDSTRNQIEGFELSLRRAIDLAASKLNERVKEAFPGVPVTLRYTAQPIVTGIALPESGAIFHVLIPSIEDVDVKILMMNAPRITSPVTPAPNRVTATGIVEPNPLAPTVPPMTDPDKEYTTFMRAALIDALLDHALSVPIPQGQHLTVIAGELQTQPVSPFDPRSRFLILQLKGEDLLALRENRINRDEAKNRIKETRYPN